MRYKLYLDSDGGLSESIMLINDQDMVFCIPNDPDNLDWQKYQEWLAQDNEPEPAE